MLAAVLVVLLTQALGPPGAGALAAVEGEAEAGSRALARQPPGGGPGRESVFFGNGWLFALEDPRNTASEETCAFPTDVGVSRTRQARGTARNSVAATTAAATAAAATAAATAAALCSSNGAQCSRSSSASAAC